MPSPAGETRGSCDTAALCCITARDASHPSCQKGTSPPKQTPPNPFFPLPTLALSSLTSWPGFGREKLWTMLGVPIPLLPPSDSSTWHLSSHKNKGRLPPPEKKKKSRPRAWCGGDDERGVQPTSQGRPEGPRAGTNLLKAGWQELKGGRGGGSAPRGGSRPALGEWGRRLEEGAPGRTPAAASGSAAARRSPDHAWPHRRYRYARSRALSAPPPLPTRPARGHLKIHPPGCPLGTSPGPGAAAPRRRGREREGGSGGGSEEGSALRTGRWGASTSVRGRLTAELAAPRPASP